MADEAHAPQSERIEDGEDVVGHRLLVVTAGRGVGPAETAQVDHHQLRVRCEQRHQVAPDPPVLRPAVQEHDRLARARLGDVEAQPPRHDRAVRDAVELGEVHQGWRTILRASRWS